jgi:hypothetical protein
LLLPLSLLLCLLFLLLRPPLSLLPALSPWQQVLQLSLLFSTAPAVVLPLPLFIPGLLLDLLLDLLLGLLVWSVLGLLVRLLLALLVWSVLGLLVRLLLGLPVWSLLGLLLGPLRVLLLLCLVLGWPPLHDLVPTSHLKVARKRPVLSRTCLLELGRWGGRSTTLRLPLVGSLPPPLPLPQLPSPLLTLLGLSDVSTSMLNTGRKLIF